MLGTLSAKAKTGEEELLGKQMTGQDQQEGKISEDLCREDEPLGSVGAGSDIHEIASKSVEANCYKPQFAV